MELFWLAGATILLFTWIFDGKVLAFDKEFYLRWLKIIAIGSTVSIVINFFLGRFPPLPDLGFGSLLMVGWEDLVFSLLPIYYGRKYLHRHVSTIVTVIASIAFGLGHNYQGWFAVVLLSFAPYFISYKIGRKYGYGTSMALHVSYDIILHIATIILGAAANV